MAGLRVRAGGLSVVLLCGGALASGQENGKTLRAPLVEELPTPDGRLDEAVWARAAVAGDFVQYEPSQGAPPTWATEVRVAYTREALLIGARLFDDQPEQIVAREYRRDANLDSDDNFMVVLDTYHDHRSGFFFSTNAAGTRQDGLVQNEGATITNEWDGVWSVGSRRTGDGWVAELVIPFETLRFPSGAREFGVNFGRQVARSREQSFWAEIHRDWGFNAIWRISAYGGLTGLEHAEPGGRIKLKPFGIGGVTGDEEERAGTADAGLDAKIALSSNLNLDLTLNTDFAQVEADEQQVNLTRFELFFPEQRDFFLENAGLFEVGEVTRPFDPKSTLLFFSRRIGLSEDGEIVPILGGARVTGKLGKTDLGVFHIRQEAFRDESPATGFTGIRLRRDVLARSSIGLFALDRTGTDGSGSHRVAAADFSWAWSRFSNLSGFVARSSTPGVEGRQTAASLHAEATNDRFSLFSNFTDIGEGFRSEMGFVPRTGIRRVRVDGLWSPRIGRFGIRQVFVGPNLVRITEPDGRVQTQELGFGPYILLEDGGNVFFSATRNTEGLSESFELRDGVEIAAGEYRTTGFLGMLNTSESRRLSLNLFAMTGGFFDGELRVLSPGAAFRPHPRLRFGINLSRSQIRLPQEGGHFDTNLIVLRGLIALSPDAFVRGLLQWNDDDGDFSGNIQLRWTWRPGSDLHVVYNERRPFGAGSEVSGYRELLAKITWYHTAG